MQIFNIINNEISEYIEGNVDIGDGIRFSEYALKKRIQLFKNRYYITGKVTEGGDYEYWMDIISPRVMTEVKNLDIDTKHILIYSENPVKDFAVVYVANLALKNWLWKKNKAEELNTQVENFVQDGNVLWEKHGKSYEVWDMLNTFITNQTAETVDDTAIIKRFYLTQTELRKKEGIYKNIESVIDSCGNKFYSRTDLSADEPSSSPLYEIFARTGEVSEKVLNEAMGKEGGSPTKFVLARIVVAGLRKGSSENQYILFAEELKGKMSDHYIEAHRGTYKGRWFREGLVETLFDVQVRYNDICNEIARGLEWASKIIYRHTDIQSVQNIRTALENGSTIRSADLQQVQVRLQGFDQLVADREACLAEADRLANSFEVTAGQTLPAQTPFKLAQLLDNNANALFAYYRQKFATPYERVFQMFTLKDVVKDMKGEDIIRVSGDENVLEGFYRIAVDSWYINNLAEIGAHPRELVDAIKAEKMEELKQTDPALKNVKELWDDVLPRLNVTITGESYSDEMETISNLIQFEQDPTRRAYLLDWIYSSRGIPVPPAVEQAEQVEQMQAQQEPLTV